LEECLALSGDERHRGRQGIQSVLGKNDSLYLFFLQKASKIRNSEAKFSLEKK